MMQELLTGNTSCMTILQKENAMPISEQSMRFLEEHTPELAQSAVTQAYWQALASGN
jgi:hypothetical protein